MGRKAGWILGAVLAVALYATPAAAQVSVSVGIGVPPVAAGVVIGGPVPVYPAYPPYYYYPYRLLPVPVYRKRVLAPALLLRSSRALLLSRRAALLRRSALLRWTALLQRCGIPG